jgi:hypothetical protein
MAAMQNQGRSLKEKTHQNIALENVALALP